LKREEQLKEKRTFREREMARVDVKKSESSISGAQFEG
jgi:hypothetical protein